MPREGDEITNPITGQVMLFKRISPDELVIESVHPATDQREPLHVHPAQESSAELLAGTLAFELDGRVRELNAGESISIPANAPHRFWNDSGSEARSLQTFRPALAIADFFETYFELARQGRIGRNGEIPLLNVAMMTPVFANEIRLTSPPWPIVRLTAFVLRPLARLRGVQPRLRYGVNGR